MSKKNTIVLVGQPNCGKSTLFNHLVGFKSRISNLPGTTVQLEKGEFKRKDRVYEIIDLPGIYSLTQGDEAENKTLEFLLNEEYDFIVNILDASMLSRGLELTLQLLKIGKPMVVVLNMMDEAKRKGIIIDVKKLEKLLKVPVIPAIASRGVGIKELFEAIENFKGPVLCFLEDLPGNLRKEADKLTDVLKDCNLNRRHCALYFLATKILGGELSLDTVIKDKGCREKANMIIKEARELFLKEFSMEPEDVIHALRHHTAMTLAEKVVTFKRKRSLSFLEKIDSVVMHPVFGYLIMAIVYLGFFYLTFKIGGYLEDYFTKPFELLYTQKTGLIYSLWNATVDGLSGGIGIVFPYLLPLMFFISILEDIGYIPRAAYLMDTLMHRFGLHGKSVVPLLLGYGCNVPAITATRIIEEERNRVLTALLVPFIPCSARLTVLLAISDKFLGPLFAIGVLFLNIIVVGIVGKILTLIKKEDSPGIVLEIPSYKIPSMKITLAKTWLHVKEFIFVAWPMLIAGSIVLGLIQFYGIEQIINEILYPFTRGLLGLPSKVGVTLLFGILRKELTLIMLQTAMGTPLSQIGNVMTHVQLATFTVFTIFYIPCIATLAAIYKEFNKKIMFYSILLSTFVATVLAITTRFLYLWL